MFFFLVVVVVVLFVCCCFLPFMLFSLLCVFSGIFLFVSVKTIGSACVVGSDCIEINSICLYSICHCDSTTKYTHATWSCDKGGFKNDVIT